MSERRTQRSGRTPTIAADEQLVSLPVRARPAVSVVVPTYNEADNIEVVLDRLRSHLDSHQYRDGYEIVVVDDNSPDETWRLAQHVAEHDHRISVVRRASDRGLASAVLTGLSVASGSVMVVMDADLQHDPAVVPRLVAPVLEGGHQVCVASRTSGGGSFGRFTRSRRLISFTGNSVARLLLGTHCTDPMSGFFAISRGYYETVAPSVNPRGFKILLEFLARGKNPNVTEVGYRFGERLSGETKLNGSVVLNYLVALISLSIGRVLPATFVMYLAVGLIGLAVRAAVEQLGTALSSSAWASPIVLIAVEAGLVVNYLLHNRITFEPFRHRGVHMIRGLISFHVVSLHGLLVHAGVMALLSSAAPSADTELLATTFSPPFLLAGALATIGNYHINAGTTWQT